MKNISNYIKELGVVICGLFVFTCLFFPMFARADTIHLKNGKHFDGIVMQEGDGKIVFDVIMGADRMRMTFLRGEVERIERTSSGEREALVHEMVEGRKEREELEEEMRKQGLVLYRGKWIKEEERSSADEAGEARINGGSPPSRRPVAPQFELPDLEGNLHSMHQYSGRLILLFFWETGSRTCARQVHTLKRAYDKYMDDGVVILGISVDVNMNRVRDFVNSRKVNFPVLCDGKGWKSPVVREYGVGRLPATVLIDRAGYIRSSGMFGEYIGKEIEKLLNK